MPTASWHGGARCPAGISRGLDTHLDFAALDSRHGYTLFLPQAHTEELLAERARELGVDIERGHAITGFRGNDTGIEVEVRGPGGPTTVRAKYLAGCDGGRSFVRQAAGIGFPGTDETVTGMLGDFAVTDPAAVSRARDGGVLIVPLENGVTRFVLMDPERMRVPSTEPVTLREMRESLVRVLGTDCGVAEPRWLSRFGNTTRLADTYRAGRVLVAGDAAHIHFPAAGQGLNTGLQDAVNLGWKLAAEVHGWAPPGLLDTYHHERHPIGQAVTANTELQTLLMELTLVPQYERPTASLRNLLAELLGITEVNRRLAGLVSGLDITYPGSGTDPQVGRRMPDLIVKTPHAAVSRVYELLHEGRFLLLDLTGETEGSAWGDRVIALVVTGHEDHPDLGGVTELLVRPDGHIAWATRGSDLRTRRAERTAALTAWTGTPAGKERHWIV